jgi:hypothetical protein
MNREAESAVLRAVAAEWRKVNLDRLGGVLRPPVFQLAEGESQLGFWRRGERVLSLSRNMVATVAWVDVVDVLKHEIAHQFVDEVLRPHDEPPHGPSFVETCRRLGIDPAASGRPSADASGDERMLKRIRQLLALAESPNRNEAEAAMRAAQRLMLKYNIELSSLNKSSYQSRQLTPPRLRMDAAEKMLGGLLGSHFFVSPMIVPAFDVERQLWGRVIEISGTVENLEIAAWVFEWVLATAERLWIAHRRADRSVPGGDRRTYIAGVVSGFGETLRVGQREAKAAGLVWAGDPARSAYMDHRHPRVSTSRVSVRNGEAFADGRDAGRKLVLHKPVTATEDRGRLLSGEVGRRG